MSIREFLIVFFVFMDREHFLEIDVFAEIIGNGDAFKLTFSFQLAIEVVVSTGSEREVVVKDSLLK